MLLALKIIAMVLLGLFVIIMMAIIVLYGLSILQQLKNSKRGQIKHDAHIEEVD